MRLSRSPAPEGRQFIARGLKPLVRERSKIVSAPEGRKKAPCQFRPKGTSLGLPVATCSSARIWSTAGPHKYRCKGAVATPDSGWIRQVSRVGPIPGPIPFDSPAGSL